MPIKHMVSVMTLPRERDGDLYYFVCSCGTTGEHRARKATATKEAHEHQDSQ